MKILRDAEVPPLPEGGKVYRDTDWVGLAVGLIFSGLALGALAAPVLTGTWASFWSTAAWLAGALFAALMGRFALRCFRASRAPDAWILRWTPERVWLRYRSYYNHRFPADTPSVLQLDRREVAWVRRRSKEFEVPDESGNWSREGRIRGIELGLRNMETETLATALKEEARRRDFRGARFNHYPVILSREGTLRVDLRRPKTVIEALSTYYPIDLAAEEQAKSFADMSLAEKEEHVLTLAQAGQTLAAIKAAREIYGCDLATAKQLVEELMTD